MEREFRIFVCIKQVPGTTEVEIDENGSLMRSQIESKMNPFDLFAIETALQIKEKRGGHITALSMGPPQAEAVLREAFMMGVDEGILLTDRRFAGSDVWATSYTLSQCIRKFSPDLIICGKQTTDGDTAQVGAEIAEFLDIPHVTNVIRTVKVNDSSIIVEADLPTVVQMIKIDLPCLITVEKDIYQPRLPSFKKKLQTRGRKITIIGLDDLNDKNEKNYGLSGSPTKVQRVFPPESSVEKETWTGPPMELGERIFGKLKEQKFI